jgi:hypothetical protein
MPKRGSKPRAHKSPGEPCAPLPDPVAAARAKLKELDALKKKVKAAMGPEPAKKKHKPRFSGSWGCGAS